MADHTLLIDCRLMITNARQNILNRSLVLFHKKEELKAQKLVPIFERPASVDFALDIDWKKILN